MCVLRVGAHMWSTDAMQRPQACCIVATHTANRQSSHTHGAIPCTHAIFLYLNASELVWINLSGACILKICRCILCKPLQAKVGSPVEWWLFSIIIITSNILWRGTKQRPTWIRDARKERFLPSRSSPSLPVTSSSCAFRKGGNITVHVKSWLSCYF